MDRVTVNIEATYLPSLIKRATGPLVLPFHHGAPKSDLNTENVHDDRKLTPCAFVMIIAGA